MALKNVKHWYIISTEINSSLENQFSPKTDQTCFRLKVQKPDTESSPNTSKKPDNESSPKMSKKSDTLYSPNR